MMDWVEMSKPWLAAAPVLEQTLKPVQDRLLAAAQLTQGADVLDVGIGTGPGLQAMRTALGETGHLTGIDIAPPMVAHAAQRAPDDVTLLVGDAQSHAFEESSFDVVLSNFGMMFFSNTRAALANLRRATRDNGRFAATLWGLPKDNPWFFTPRQVSLDFVPDLPKPDHSAPGPMRFADPSGFLDDLVAARWDPTIETCDILLTPPGDARSLAAHHMTSMVGNGLRAANVPDEILAHIENALATALTAYESVDGLRIPARIHVVTARAV